MKLSQGLVLLDSLGLKLVVLFEDYAQLLFEIDRLLLMLRSILPYAPLQLCVALLSFLAEKQDLLVELLKLCDIFQRDLIARLSKF